MQCSKVIVGALCWIAGCDVEGGAPREEPQEVEPHGLRTLDRGWSPLAPLDVTFGHGAVTVRAPWEGAQEVELALVSWGLEGVERAAEVAAPRDELGRTVYDRDGLKEWWVRGAGGLEQGFEVDGAVADGGTLVLELAVTGASVVVGADGVSATLWPFGGGAGLSYEGLAAWDQRGVSLPAWMEETAGGVRLVVDATLAQGAVTVDPLLPGAAWSAEPDQVGASFGWSVASAGDVNGDGFDDVVVGAQGYDDGQTGEGAAFVYLGAAAGLSATPAWTATSNQAYAQFGVAVASAGDVNGDGYDDVLVGARGYDGGLSDEGKAYVYLGSVAGLSATPSWTAEGSQTSAFFGETAASAGDVNRDGYDDVVVGAKGYDNGSIDEGAAFLYLGSALGLSAASSWTAESNQPGGYFAESVASAGDVNGDGYDDVVVGAPWYDGGLTDEGVAVLYLGFAGGLRAAPAWTAESNLVGTFLGASVASAGDVNGDGYDDVVIGAPLFDGGQADEGQALVFLGSAAGLGVAPAWTAESNVAGAYFGMSAASAGDVNGDGYDDVVVGANRYDGGEPNEGGAALFLGSAAGLAAAPVATAESDQRNAFLGLSVASAGDVNGDGYDDVVVGAWLYDNVEIDEGSAILYLGR